jgi:hypothetical protein
MFDTLPDQQTSADPQPANDNSPASSDVLPSSPTSAMPEGATALADPELTAGLFDHYAEGGGSSKAKRRMPDDDRTKPIPEQDIPQLLQTATDLAAKTSSLYGTLFVFVDGDPDASVRSALTGLQTQRDDLTARLPPVLARVETIATVPPTTAYGRDLVERAASLQRQLELLQNTATLEDGKPPSQVELRCGGASTFLSLKSVTFDQAFDEITAAIAHHCP